MHRFTGLLAVAAGALLAACSTGTDTSATFSSPTTSSGQGGAGGDGSGTGAGTQSSSSSAAQSSSAAATSGSGGAGGGGTGGAGTGGDPSSSSSSSSGAGGATCSYASPNACADAQLMQEINGDTGSDSRVVQGTTSKWFKINVHEGYNLIGDLSYTATLESPPGMDFDLYVYPGDAAGPDCAGTPIHATGNPESASDHWSDSFGSQDDRYVAFEVRYISGTSCSATALWKLTVTGDTE